MIAVVGIFARDGEPDESLEPALDAGCEGRGWRSPPGSRSGPVAVRTSAPPGADGDPSFARDPRSGNWVVGRARLDDRENCGEALGLSRSERHARKDLELILEAYARWDTGFAIHLLGDFAFALFDAHRGRVVCVRDSLGIEPFYYSLNRDRLVFGNDLQVLAGLPSVGDRIDEVFVAAHLADYTFRHHERTFLEDVSKLPPGGLLDVGRETSSMSRFWDPARAPEVRFGSDRDYSACFLDLCRRAVGDRLRGASRVGVHVSGGLDSSAIAVLASRALGRRGGSISGFAWSPPRDHAAVEFDERDLVDAVGEREGFPVAFLRTGIEDHLRVLRRDVTRQPTEDTLIYELGVQRHAAELGIDVMLSGWGGDEFISFNGRGHDALRSAAVGSGTLRGILRGRAFLPLWSTVARRPLSHLARRIRGAGPATTNRGSSGFVSYLHPDLARSAEGAVAELRPTWCANGVRNHQLSLFRLAHLTERIESWAANGSRRNLSYRYPLLDRRIVEFALGLPPEQFIRGNRTRFLMRQALAELAPAIVTDNTNKSDPARSRDVFAQASSAMLTIGREIERRESDLPRARYLDMPRLRGRLSRNTAIGPDESRSLWHALQFLGVPASVS